LRENPDLEKLLNEAKRKQQAELRLAVALAQVEETPINKSRLSGLQPASFAVWPHLNLECNRLKELYV
jgi:hypothetical protein